MNRKSSKKNKRKLITRGHGNEPTVIEFNLSKAVILCIVIGVVIATITTVKVITTIIEGKQEKTLADVESNENVTWVESTTIGEDGVETVDKDENGEIITVPVPKGYSASRIPGETSANHGFVIYEGDIDWDEILVGETTTEVTTQSVEDVEEVEVQDEESQNEKSQQEEVTETQQNNEPVVEENTVIEEQEEVTEEVSEQGNEDNLEENKEEVIEEVNEQENVENLEENKEEKIQEQPSEKAENQEQEEKAVQESEKIENTVQTLANETDVSTTEVEVQSTEEITQEDIKIFNLQQTANQYVWVPVKDPSRIYGVDSNGKLWGKLWGFPSSATGSRTPNNWTETEGTIGIRSKTSYREPDVTHHYTGSDVDSNLQSYLDGKSQYELLSRELEELFYETIKSIKKYGGFYIGRYETGGLSGEAVVRKMETDLGSNTWYSMYEKAQKLSGNNENVKTSMIWGSLWDETLQWLVDSEATTSTGVQITYKELGSDSTDWGNYYDSTFYYIPSGSETPEETAKKSSYTSKYIPTGSAEYTKVNNIYDMAGNVWNWTLEAHSTSYRALRGGEYSKRRQQLSSYNLQRLSGQIRFDQQS